MKCFAIALIYLGFFGLIGLTVYHTKSSWPLLALIFTPSCSAKGTGE
jgi:hypothetical protein